jgi:hypothetical protein
MLMEEHRMRVFYSRVMRRICGPNSGAVMGCGENYVMRNFVVVFFSKYY